MGEFMLVQQSDLRMTKPLTYEEKEQMHDLFARHAAATLKVEDRAAAWKPRKPEEFSVPVPPMIDQKTLEEAQTGRKLTPEQYEKACNDRRKLDLQSLGIARRLGRAGVNVFQDNIFMLGLYSEHLEEKTQYKNTNFIPSVQAKNTHDMLKTVQYWLDTTPSSYTRMWVFSCGWVPLYQYREEHQKFTRWLSKFSKHKCLKATQIEFTYYSVEGTIKKDGGQTYVNLHAHVLLKAGRFLGEENWAELMEQVTARAPKGYFHDSPIRKAAEVVKYCFKPDEFELLNDDQLAYLYTATKGLRFYTPLASLREFRKELKESKLKLKHIETDSGPAWRMVKGRTRSTLEDLESDPDEDDVEGKTAGMANIVCGITAPSPTFSEVYEPSLIIRNFDGNIEGLLALNPWIEDRMASIRRTVARQEAAAEQRALLARRARQQAHLSSIRDTTTITVQNFEPDYLYHDEDDWYPPPDLSPEPINGAWA